MARRNQEGPKTVPLVAFITRRQKNAIVELLRAGTQPTISSFVRAAIDEKIERDCAQLGLDVKALLVEPAARVPSPVPRLNKEKERDVNWSK